MENHGLTCVHQPGDSTGLCPECTHWFDFDPIAYIEFGEHPEGQQRWEAEKIRMDLEAEEYNRAYPGFAVPCFDDPDPTIPF